MKMSAQGNDAAGDCTKAMNAIKDSSEKVNRITLVIADMARQTNLLSLNAAIEEATQGSTDRIRGISLAMEEQLKASQEMVAAVGTTANITDQNASATTQLAATIHEVAQTIEALARIANELKFQTARFKLA
ncbi:MAG: hypothetical protein HGB30_03360 [Holophagaceae bacterium]|nr:hypothetical protein [Holophagaceae bacterium]